MNLDDNEASVLEGYFLIAIEGVISIPVLVLCVICFPLFVVGCIFRKFVKLFECWLIERGWHVRK